MTPEQTIQKLEEMIAAVRTHLEGADIISASVHWSDEFNSILLSPFGSLPNDWTEERLCKGGNTIRILRLCDNIEVRWFPQEAPDAPD